MTSKVATKTRDGILATALQLFNEAGTAAVSTNHIAEAFGISPGNLYYHFHNKEEIIRELFEQQFDWADHMYSFPADRAPNLDDLRGVVSAAFEMNWHFRFIFRELIALLRRDAALEKRWIEVRKRGFDGFHELMQTFVDAGVLRAPSDKAEVTRLAELCWLIAEFWLPSVEVSGHKVDAGYINHGIELMMQVLAPFIITTKPALKTAAPKKARARRA